MTGKTKKIRLYKFASHYNLNVEEMIKFLITKGFNVKSKMSVLSDEMISLLREKYKRDIEILKDQFEEE